MKRPVNTNYVPGQGADRARKYWNVVLENGVYVESKHPADFMKKCFTALENNGLYTGSGWSDQIWHMVCEQNPHIDCIDTDRPPVVAGWLDVRRFFITLRELLGSSKPLVSPEVQEARIEKCLICPKNVSLGNCSGCSWVAQTLSELAGNRQIKDEPRIHRRGCGACGCELSVKTAYPVEVLRLSDDRLGLKPDYWEQCWMKSE